MLPRMLSLRCLGYLSAILIATAGCSPTPQVVVAQPSATPAANASKWPTQSWIATAGCSPTPQVVIAQPSATPAANASKWPTQSWQTSSPEEEGVDPAQLDKMLAAIEEQSISMYSILVIRHGAIVSEHYFSSYDEKDRGEIYSVTKSFTSTLIGIALDKGLLGDIDQSVLGYLADRAFESVDERKQKMTIENLLTMTPGLSWDEGDTTYTQMFRSADWTKYVLDKPMEFEPGKQFEYNSGASHVLSAIVQQATGMNTADFAQANLFEPLGITNVTWNTDSQGLSIGGWGLELAPREMAKLGYLFLHEGQWDGQQIVSADWVKAATQKHVSSDGELGYGYLWWTRADGSAYMALGRYGQTIYVKPDLDLVVVTTAHEDNHDRIFDLIDTYVVPACSD
jgi:CubicO group peptidase (beta-lactamase class C family)